MSRRVCSTDEEFAIRRIFGLPVLVTRHAVPLAVAGDWGWSRWHLARFADTLRINRAFGRMKAHGDD